MVTFGIRKQADVTLPQNSNLWNDKVFEELERSASYLMSYKPSIKWDHSSSSPASGNSKGQINVNVSGSIISVPIIVRRFNMLPFDIFSYQGKMHYLVKESIDAIDQAALGKDQFGTGPAYPIQAINAMYGGGAISYLNKFASDYLTNFAVERPAGVIEIIGNMKREMPVEFAILKKLGAIDKISNEVMASGADRRIFTVEKQDVPFQYSITSYVNGRIESQYMSSFSKIASEVDEYTANIIRQLNDDPTKHSVTFYADGEFSANKTLLKQAEELPAGPTMDTTDITNGYKPIMAPGIYSIHGTTVHVISASGKLLAIIPGENVCTTLSPGFLKGTPVEESIESVYKQQDLVSDTAWGFTEKALGGGGSKGSIVLNVILNKNSEPSRIIIRDLKVQDTPMSGRAITGMVGGERVVIFLTDRDTPTIEFTPSLNSTIHAMKADRYFTINKNRKLFVIGQEIGLNSFNEKIKPNIPLSVKTASIANNFFAERAFHKANEKLSVTWNRTSHGNHYKLATDRAPITEVRGDVELVGSLLSYGFSKEASDSILESVPAEKSGTISFYVASSNTGYRNEANPRLSERINNILKIAMLNDVMREMPEITDSVVASKIIAESDHKQASKIIPILDEAEMKVAKFLYDSRVGDLGGTETAEGLLRNIVDLKRFIHKTYSNAD